MLGQVGSGRVAGATGVVDGARHDGAEVAAGRRAHVRQHRRHGLVPQRPVLLLAPTAQASWAFQLSPGLGHTPLQADLSLGCTSPVLGGAMQGCLHIACSSQTVASLRRCMRMCGLLPWHSAWGRRRRVTCMHAQGRLPAATALTRPCASGRRTRKAHVLEHAECAGGRRTCTAAP